MLQANLLESGIYTIPDAAGLVGVSAQRVRIWVEGHSGKQAPVIHNELGKVAGKTAVSFTNLMELRFIALFARAGVKVPTIRAIMQEAQELLRHPHPFATRTVFKTDGRKIVAEIGKRNGIDDIYDLKSRNYEMKIVVMRSLRDDIVFDPEGEAITWRPRKEIAPHVVVHPKFSFGRPVLKESRIPTSALADAMKAERSARTVARLFEVPEGQVREAVKFEASLRTLH